MVFPKPPSFQTSAVGLGFGVVFFFLPPPTFCFVFSLQGTRLENKLVEYAGRVVLPAPAGTATLWFDVK